MLLTWMALKAGLGIVTKKLVISNSLVFIALMIKTVLFMILVEKFSDCCTGTQAVTV